jgi:hypothetical protein
VTILRTASARGDHKVRLDMHSSSEAGDLRPL